MLKFQHSNADPFLPQDWLLPYEGPLTLATHLLTTHSGPGGDFTGWVALPRDYDKAEFARIQAAAEKIRKQSQVLVVIGIGGSYLGARAVLELLRSPNYNLKKKDTPDLYFAGNGLSSAALNELLELIGDRDFSVNVISKSGTTTEPAVAFRIFREKLEARYGKEGARDAMERLSVPGMDNPAWQYAAARHALYSSGKRIEILAAYEPAFRFFGEWWKQLFGESEGKEGKGLFPASVEFTADLHSMGQYIQQGQRLMLETVVRFAPGPSPVVIPEDKDNVDGLNFLAGKSLDFVAEQAMRGTILAHVDGGVPNLMVEADALSAHTAGELIYFFEYTCGLSGYLLGVNPFDQPGVEAYKKNMFALLGKPGYEEQKAALEARL